MGVAVRMAVLDTLSRGPGRNGSDTPVLTASASSRLGVDLRGDLLVRTERSPISAPPGPSRWGRRRVRGRSRVVPRVRRYAGFVGRTWVRVSRDNRLRRAAASAGGITTVAALRTAIPRSTIRRWSGADDPRRETGAVTILPYGAATAGAGRRTGGAWVVAGGGCGRVHRWDARHRIVRLMRLGCLRPRVSAPASCSIRRNRPLRGVARRPRANSPRAGLPGIPAAAEAILIARDISLARLTGGAVHFAHVSTGDALDLIRRAKADGLAVTCDTAPPYFDLNENEIGDFRTRSRRRRCGARRTGWRCWRLSPMARSMPLHRTTSRVMRTISANRSPRRARWHGIGDAAGHHTGACARRRNSLGQAIELLTARPARLLGVETGRIGKGLPADLCLFNPERIWQVEAGRLPGKAQNTPFDGRALEGSCWGRGKLAAGCSARCWSPAPTCLATCSARFHLGSFSPAWQAWEISAASVRVISAPPTSCARAIRRSRQPRCCWMG